MKVNRHHRFLFLAGFLMILLAGCSADNPVGSGDSNAVSPTQPVFLIAGDPVQISARVATIDPTQQMLTFVDHPETAVVDEETEIFTIQQGVETPVPFDYIQIGDSVQVCGTLQESGYILANRIRVYLESDCPDYDLSFRDIITAIDYDAGTFTVSERTETITTDAFTIIWGVDGGKVEFTEQAATGNFGTNAKVVVGNVPSFRIVGYAFTDLKVGDVVEVKANIVNSSTLLAVSIKLADSNFKDCVEFDGLIASLDCDTRIVTFQDFDWIGWVCPGAVLTGLDGTPLALCDFSVGDQVAVKGYPTEGDTLKVCLMEQQ
ncbi:MAG: hypothetical protein CVT49_05670 [candidate division Zixibacteria bacterium HGW-Zixibacteria-1]|nr:MAG: hypothetical protein CVT49_05670 [candidate division Zixibacteria bacterium HGW-Zixibacteria-1]